MMRIFLAFLTICISTHFLSGQALKKITIKNESPWTKEVLDVLKSDNKIRHGKYEKSLCGNKLCSGQYINGNKAGIWDYYNANGQVSQKIDFTKYQLVESNDNQKGVYVLGGLGQLYRLIGSTMRYPNEARRMATQGKVMVKFIIDRNGQLKDFRIDSRIGDGCDEEAIRVLQSNGQEWFPYINEEGKAQETEMTLPITFRLS